MDTLPVVLGDTNWLMDIAAYGPITVAGTALLVILVTRIVRRVGGRKHKKALDERDSSIGEIISWAMDISTSRARSSQRVVLDPEVDQARWEYDAKETVLYLDVLRLARVRNETIKSIVQQSVQVKELKDSVDYIVKMSDDIFETSDRLSGNIQTSLQTEQKYKSDLAMLNESSSSEKEYTEAVDRLNIDMHKQISEDDKVIWHGFYELDKQRRALERKCTDLINAVVQLRSQMSK